MNRTNLSPNTTAACLAALTEAAERTEREFCKADKQRADKRALYDEYRHIVEAERELGRELRGLVASTQTVESNMRQARLALAEFRRVAGIDEDRDAGEITHVG